MTPKATQFLQRIKMTDATQIQTELEALDGWCVRGDALVRVFVFDDFLTAVAFINTIAPIAEALDHHPELYNVYNRVELVLNTHDVGGLTEFDFVLAARIDEVARAYTLHAS